jgi:hypothetical protein
MTINAYEQWAAAALAPFVAVTFIFLLLWVKGKRCPAGDEADANLKLQRLIWIVFTASYPQVTRRVLETWNFRPQENNDEFSVQGVLKDSYVLQWAACGLVIVLLSLSFDTALFKRSRIGLAAWSAVWYCMERCPPTVGAAICKRCVSCCCCCQRLSCSRCQRLARWIKFLKTCCQKICCQKFLNSACCENALLSLIAETPISAFGTLASLACILAAGMISDKFISSHLISVLNVCGAAWLSNVLLVHFVLGFPIRIAVAIRRASSEDIMYQKDSAAMQTLGWLYLKYNQQNNLYEFWFLIEKVLMASTLTFFFIADHSLVQALILITFRVFGLVLVLWRKPYSTVAEQLEREMLSSQKHTIEHHYTNRACEQRLQVEASATLLVRMRAWWRGLAVLTRLDIMLQLNSLGCMVTGLGFEEFESQARNHTDWNSTAPHHRTAATNAAQGQELSATPQMLCTAVFFLLLQGMVIMTATVSQSLVYADATAKRELKRRLLEDAVRSARKELSPNQPGMQSNFERICRSLDYLKDAAFLKYSLTTNTIAGESLDELVDLVTKQAGNNEDNNRDGDFGLKDNSEEESNNGDGDEDDNEDPDCSSDDDEVFNDDSPPKKSKARKRRCKDQCTASIMTGQAQAVAAVKISEAKVRLKCQLLDQAAQAAARVQLQCKCTDCEWPDFSAKYAAARKISTTRSLRAVAGSSTGATGTGGGSGDVGGGMTKRPWGRLVV